MGWWINIFLILVITLVFWVIFSFWVFIKLLKLLTIVVYFYSTILTLILEVVFYTLHQSIVVSLRLILTFFFFILPFFSYLPLIKISSFHLIYYFYHPFWSFLKILKSHIFHHSDPVFFVMSWFILLYLLLWYSLLLSSAILIVFVVLWYLFLKSILFESLWLIFWVLNSVLMFWIVI